MLLQILFFSVTLAAAQILPQPNRTLIKVMYDMGGCDSGGTITVCGPGTQWVDAECVFSDINTNIQPTRTRIKDMYNNGGCDSGGTITLCSPWTPWDGAECALHPAIEPLLKNYTKAEISSMLVAGAITVSETVSVSEALAAVAEALAAVAGGAAETSASEAVAAETVSEAETAEAAVAVEP